MKKLLSLFAILPLSLLAQTDFRFDKKVYHNLDATELCSYLSKHPNTVLIDVRTPGEFSDTSQWGNLNIGHLKNAVNIPIDTIENSFASIEKYRKSRVILYCSHSQRSRRVSKLLAEKGFRSFVNLNGGLSYLNQLDEEQFPCKTALIERNISYKAISGADAIQLIADKNPLIIDLRTASEFNGIDSTEELNIGRIKGAINIPYSNFREEAEKVDVPLDRAILVYDNHGEFSHHIATELTKYGYQTYRIINGIQAFVGKEKSTLDKRANLLEATPEYKLLNSRESLDLLKSGQATIIDTRDTVIYNNHSSMHHHNVGHIRGAINIPTDLFEVFYRENGIRTTSPILVYGGPEAAAFAQELCKRGYSNVNLMFNGLWSLVSAYANVKGFEDVKKYMMETEGKF